MAYNVTLYAIHWCWLAFCLSASILSAQGTTSKIVAQLIGLSIKAQTRRLEDAAAAASAAAQRGPPASHSDGSSGKAQQPTSQEQPVQAMQQQQQQQQVATSILEPCDIRVSMKADDAVQDINVDVSALQLRMSPDVMQLLLHLQQVGVLLFHSCGVSLPRCFLLSKWLLVSIDVVSI